jgi:hypothetical protein
MKAAARYDKLIAPSVTRHVHAKAAVDQHDFVHNAYGPRNRVAIALVTDQEIAVLLQAAPVAKATQVPISAQDIATKATPQVTPQQDHLPLPLTTQEIADRKVIRTKAMRVAKSNEVRLQLEQDQAAQVVTTERAQVYLQRTAQVNESEQAPTPPIQPGSIDERRDRRHTVMRVARATEVRLRHEQDQAAQVETTQHQHAPVRLPTAQANDSNATDPQGQK